jgi:chromate transporter
MTPIARGETIDAPVVTSRPSVDPPSGAPLPSLAEATRVWLKLGLLGFGGPAGQIALTHRLVVDEKQWLSEPQFLHALNFCMLLPGPEAQQLATYAGWLLHGWRGGLIAGSLFVLPGFFVIVALSALYVGFASTDWLQIVFLGLKAAVLAIVVEALLKVARRALRTPLMYVVASAAFVAIWALHVPFPAIVLGAAVLGALLGRVAPELVAVAGERPAATAAAAPGWHRSLRTTLLGLAVWLGPVAALLLAVGPDHVLARMAVFFSQMAVVTFGGAYAVLAWVAQAAVQDFGWLQPGQMVDGLALAETTPGPLILVLTFVGFVGAWQAMSGLDPWLAALAGSVIVTWVTFAPCFLWIFLGAPYVERLRGQRALAGALATITAAVVGVILNLALWFGLHVLFAELIDADLGPLRLLVPVWASIDPAALTLSILAAYMLFGTRLGMIATLLACGVAGAALRLLGF